MLCATGATVIWTRHRRPPDMTPWIRDCFAAAGFDEVAFVAPDQSMFTVGVGRFTREPTPFDADARLFSFVGYDALVDACARCGFSYDLGRPEITPWLRSDARAFVGVLEQLDIDTMRRRSATEVWSPLEYACHVRDVLRIQLERVLQAQREPNPSFAPMRREERVVEDRYNDQDPATVSVEIISAAEALASTLDAFDDDAWSRTGIYNYPERRVRTVEWIAIHTVHELLHHRVDIGTLA
jgi:hypothetical protein